MSESSTSRTSEYFDAHSGAWSGRYAVAGHFKDRLQTALDWLPAGPGTALDYGCGSGVLACSMLQRDYHVTAVDASSGMIAAAQAALGDAAGGRADRFCVEQVDPGTEGGEWRGRQFDAVYSLGVLEYVDRVEELLAGLANAVAPSGVLVLSVPNRRSWLRLIEAAIHRAGKWIRPLGIARHLTGEDSYLNLQRHQFEKDQLDLALAAHGLVADRTRFAVAPRFLGRLAASERIGMTILARYRRG